MNRDEFVDLDSHPPRPELRRAPRTELAVYRVRVELDDSVPPIWRELHVRSALTLDVVHQVVQAAFSWTDSHLHRFSIGGLPFDQASQLFLCPDDVDDLDGEDLGPSASTVRLDETLHEPGDVLHYVYDYGDFWELTIRLEEVLPARAAFPSAELVAGDRAAPPEDCGGLTDAASLAEVLDDPARFERAAIDTALRGSYFSLREAGVDRRVVDLLHRLKYTSVGADVDARAHLLATAPRTLDDAELSSHLAAYRWFLDRAAGAGIPLTPAGYLKPSLVAEAAKAVPVAGDWPGSFSKEVDCFPLLAFRKSLQSMGLVRRHKGALVLTKAGKVCQQDLRKLWEHLATRLRPTTEDTFDVQSALLLLAYVGSTTEDRVPYADVAAALTELGWRHPDGKPVQSYSLYHSPAQVTLINVTVGPSFRDRRLSRGAAALARAALRS